MFRTPRNFGKISGLSGLREKAGALCRGEKDRDKHSRSPQALPFGRSTAATACRCTGNATSRSYRFNYNSASLPLSICLCLSNFCLSSCFGLSLFISMCPYLSFVSISLCLFVSLYLFPHVRVYLFGNVYLYLSLSLSFYLFTLVAVDRFTKWHFRVAVCISPFQVPLSFHSFFLFVSEYF